MRRHKWNNGAEYKTKTPAMQMWIRGHWFVATAALQSLGKGWQIQLGYFGFPMEKIPWALHLTPSQNQRWANQRRKCRIQHNIEDCLCGKYYKTKQEIVPIEGKTDKIDYIKIKNFFLSKQAITREVKESHGAGKNAQHKETNTGLIPRIDQGVSGIGLRNSNNPIFFKGLKTRTALFTKRKSKDNKHKKR